MGFRTMKLACVRVVSAVAAGVVLAPGLSWSGEPTPAADTVSATEIRSGNPSGPDIRDLCRGGVGFCVRPDPRDRDRFPDRDRDRPRFCDARNSDRFCRDRDLDPRFPRTRRGGDIIIIPE